MKGVARYMDRETLLKAIHFDHPDAVPVVFHINSACWDRYDRDSLGRLVESHPILFPEGLPDYVAKGEAVPYSDWCRADKKWTDPWGCVWETRTSGFVGTVVEHPISSLSELQHFKSPDPDKTTHWYPVTWKKGESPTGGPIGFFDCLPSGEIGHGHTFLKMIDILGYEQTLYAMHDEAPELSLLIDMLEKFNLGLVERFIDIAEVQWLGYAEDLGMQIGPMLSPKMFRTWILPVYRTIMEPAEKSGVVIHMHSDGDVRALFDDLRTLPVDVFNIQDNANTLPWLKENLGGKVTLDLDIDRQHITRQSDPTLVDEYLADVMCTLYDPAGGLLLTYGLYPGTPLGNAKVIMDFLERVAEGGKPWTS